MSSIPQTNFLSPMPTLSTVFPAPLSPHALDVAQRSPGICFIAPNEVRPFDAVPLFRMAMPGTLYMSVGTERGFMSAGLAEAGALLLVDRCPVATLYNAINIGLLQMAGDGNINDYRHLRIQSNAREWQDRSWLVQDLGARALFSNGAAFHWWSQEVLADDLFFSFHTPPETSDHNYFGANYLYDEMLFSHVQRLAKTGQIRAVNERLGTSSLSSGVFSILKSASVQLGVLDLSNAWTDGYMNLDETTSVAVAAAGISNERSLLILTEMSRALDTDYAGINLRYLLRRYSEVSLPQFWARLSECGLSNVEDELPGSWFQQGMRGSPLKQIIRQRRREERIHGR